MEKKRMTVLRKNAIALLIIFAVQIAWASPIDELVKRVKSDIDRGNYDLAMTQTDSALAITPSDFKLIRLKADIFFAQNLSDSALKYYELTLSQKPKDPDALYGAGISAINLNQTTKALDYFTRGTKSGKRKAEFLYGLGLAQMQSGSLAEADVTMRKAIKADPKNPRYHEGWADVNFKKEVWSFAITGYQEAIRLDSTNGQLYNKLARAQFQSRQFNEAIANFKTFLKFVPDDTAAWFDVGRIFLASKNYAEAAYCFTKLTELRPNNGEYWYDLGESYYNLKEYEKCGEALEKAVTMNFKVAESYKMLAKVYQLRKEYYKADSAYTRYENAMGQPQEADYWIDKGKVMINIGKTNPEFLERAIAAFDKAISLDSLNSAALEYAGLVRYYKENYGAAIPYFEKKVALDGDNVSANTLRNLAFCYLKIENYNKSASTLEEAIKLKPDDAAMHQMLGNIYKFRGSPENGLLTKAIDHLKIALKDTTGTIQNGEKCKIKGDIGYCYVILRDCDNAIPYLEQAVVCNPKDEGVNLSMAQAYHLCNRLKDANAYYEKTLEINPKNKLAIEGRARTTIR
jgi:tetratricopeptide (TPR) repeat protein